MQIRNDGLNPRIQPQSHLSKLPGAGHSEVRDIAKGLLSVVNKYSKQLRKNLEQWNIDTQKIKTLLDNSSIKNLPTAIRILQSATKEPPSSSWGYGSNSISGDGAKTLYDLANDKSRNPNPFSGIKIMMFSIKYKDKEGGVHEYTGENIGSMKDACEQINDLRARGNTLDYSSLKIFLTPQQAKEDILHLESQLMDQIEKLGPKIAELQSHQQKVTLQIMYNYSSMKSNQRTLSSTIRALKTMAEAGLNSLRH